MTYNVFIVLYCIYIYMYIHSNDINTTFQNCMGFLCVFGLTHFKCCIVFSCLQNHPSEKEFRNFARLLESFSYHLALGN